jgi:pyruvate/2-oxoglutarate dehydrogenase complex dihydrolipoamide acyltransferase (E2) component
MDEIRVPKFGMSAVEAEILEIFVSVGDDVRQGQPVAEAASDKVDFVIESDQDGVVDGVHVSVGDTCPMGSVIITLR